MNRNATMNRQHGEHLLNTANGIPRPLDNTNMLFEMGMVNQMGVANTQPVQPTATRTSTLLSAAAAQADGAAAIKHTGKSVPVACPDAQLQMRPIEADRVSMGFDKNYLVRSSTVLQQVQEQGAATRGADGDHRPAATAKPEAQPRKRKLDQHRKRDRRSRCCLRRACCSTSRTE